jgi:tellurite resistance protein TerC
MVTWLWVGFILFVIAMLALDLGVFNRKAHVIGIREALGWTAFWVVLALCFNVAIYFMYEHQWCGIGVEVGHPTGGQQAALDFLTGYVIEKSLSLDNIFVIALIFSYFGVPAIYQHRVLFWGILGALVMRGAMILAGAALIKRFDWIVYVFGGFLILTAVKMLVVRHDTIDPNRNPLVRFARKVYPVSANFEGPKFFTRMHGVRAITPLFLVLLVVESSDLMFAVDSIPAIFAVTHDPFLVFTSNVFAILGLRSLYFALAGMMGKFQYLKTSLVFVLAYVGVKMILSHHYPIPTPVSLAVIAGVIVVGVIASLVHRGPSQAARDRGVTRQVMELGEFLWRRARSIAIILIGGSVVLVGVAMLVLPGPAFLVIPAGLAILGTEVLWARRIMKRLKQKYRDLAYTVGLTTTRAYENDDARGEAEEPVGASSGAGSPGRGASGGDCR